MMAHDDTLEDELDRIIAEYADRRNAGDAVDRAALLAAIPSARREDLARCLDLIDGGEVTVGKPQVLAPGERLGEYRIDAAIGRGGMAWVFRATHVALRRVVALKVMRPGLSVDPRHVDRFRREAAAAARLSHPHVVPVFEVGHDRGIHFLAMEWVAGPSLAQVQRGVGRRDSGADLARAAGIAQLGSAEEPFEAAVGRLLAAVARGVAAAHERGIVHRDLKPSNILLHPDGRPVVADFGLAKGDGDLALSLTGMPIGTPFYMSPEQVAASSASVDRRSDVYSLGVTLYECLSGRRPFEGESALAVFDAIRHLAPPALISIAPRSSADAREVVARAMARDPARRYPDALMLAADLQALGEERPTRARLESSGFWRRAGAIAAALVRGEACEFRSASGLFGLPWVHVLLRGRRRTLRLASARGWLAIGPIAYGVIAIGNLAVGGITLGAASIGLLGLGALCLGGLLFGGVSIGAVAVGGLAAGWASVGGLAVGEVAVGGMAIGHVAIGGGARGALVVSAQRADREAVEWIDDHARLLWILVPDRTEALIRLRGG